MMKEIKLKSDIIIKFHVNLSDFESKPPDDFKVNGDDIESLVISEVEQALNSMGKITIDSGIVIYPRFHFKEIIYAR